MRFRRVAGTWAKTRYESSRGKQLENPSKTRTLKQSWCKFSWKPDFCSPRKHTHQTQRRNRWNEYFQDWSCGLSSLSPRRDSVSWGRQVACLMSSRGVFLSVPTSVATCPLVFGNSSPVCGHFPSATGGDPHHRTVINGGSLHRGPMQEQTKTAMHLVRRLRGSLGYDCEDGVVVKAGPWYDRCLHEDLGRTGGPGTGGLRRHPQSRERALTPPLAPPRRPASGVHA